MIDPATPADSENSDWIISIIEPTAVIGALRLNAIRIIVMTISSVSLDDGLFFTSFIILFVGRKGNDMRGESLYKIRRRFAQIGHRLFEINWLGLHPVIL